MYDELVEEMRGQDSEHPGLLVALWPPPDVAHQLAVGDGEPEEDLHLTLAYCPDANPDSVTLARLIVELDSVARACPPVGAKVSGLGVFQAGGDDGKHVLYASVDAPDLDKLRMRACGALSTSGIEKSKTHGYTPHITLEYVPVGAEVEGTGVESDEVVGRLFNRTGPIQFHFDRLVLARGGEELEFPLTGSRANASVSPSLYESIRSAATAILMESAAAAGSTALSEYTPIPLIEAPSDKDGSKWRVLLIKAGTSANRVHYPEDVLRQAAPLFEGTRAYADHPTRDDARNRPERSVRDIVGWYDDVRYDPKVKGLTADFNVLPSAGWLREGMLDAYNRGKPDLFGFSINAQGSKTGRVVEGGYLLEAITSVRSTDVVTVPGAGGRVLDVLEADTMDPELREALDGLRADILEAVAPLLEGFVKKGGGRKPLSAAHKAAISAALKGKGKKSAARAKVKGKDAARGVDKDGNSAKDRLTFHKAKKEGSLAVHRVPGEKRGGGANVVAKKGGVFGKGPFPVQQVVSSKGREHSANPKYLKPYNEKKDGAVKTGVNERPAGKRAKAKKVKKSTGPSTQIGREKPSNSMSGPGASYLY